MCGGEYGDTHSENLLCAKCVLAEEYMFGSGVQLFRKVRLVTGAVAD